MRDFFLDTNTMINKSLSHKNVLRFCHSVGALRNPGYARETRANNKDSMNWVPWSSHGMTEFFVKNSVYVFLR